MSRYGYFDDERREYVITNPRPPVKWINYLGTLDFGGFVDHTGGLLLCKGDPALNRITKYIPQLPDSDVKGSTLYLRRKTASGYRILSPLFVPTLEEPERFACCVGLGYTRIESLVGGIETAVTYFVPPGASCLVQDIRVRNRTKETLDLDLIPLVEYTHFDALKQFTNADWAPQTMQSEPLWEEDGRLVLFQYAFMRRDTAVNYLTSNHPVRSFESDRRRFLGRNGYGSWANPGALQEDALSDYAARRGDNVGVLLHRLADLAPGETRRVIVQLGQATNREAARAAIARYRDPAEVDAALAELADFWRRYLDRVQVETPSPAMNRMLNVHNPRQCYVTKQWSRYLSLYQLGLGARGIGVRDSAQDVMGILGNAPEEGKALLRRLLSVQKRDGSSMHQFNPLTMAANAGDAREEPERPQFYSDDHLWVILAVCAYLKETADFAFLDAVVPFYEKDAAEQPIESGPVRQHLQRGVAFTRQTVGDHGLPLLGFADWNDTVNLPAGAESAFTACLYGAALRELIALMEHLGDEAAARAYGDAYQEMKSRFNQVAWDGDWYLRYVDHKGRPLGSRQNSHGQIYTNAQSWPVLAGFAPPERARRALDAVAARLNTRHGVKLSAPGYDGFDPEKGGVTTYPPGAKENGGIFLHANPWVIIAETRLGRGDRAFAYYDQINPAAKNEQIETYECEPYVYPQNILGDEHPQFGLARNSWLTGTASWTYQAGVQHILGIRAAYDGLEIDPCIPPDWSGFTATRVFRGATYHISVENPEWTGHGVRELWVDGKMGEGKRIRPFSGGDHRVRVVLGA